MQVFFAKTACAGEVRLRYAFDFEKIWSAEKILGLEADC